MKNSTSVLTVKKSIVTIFNYSDGSQKPQMHTTGSTVIF